MYFHLPWTWPPRKRPAAAPKGPQPYPRADAPALKVVALPDHLVFQAVWPDPAGYAPEEFKQAAFRMGMAAAQAVDPDEEGCPAADAVEFAGERYGTAADRGFADLALKVVDHLLGGRRERAADRPLVDPARVFMGQDERG